jgi:zinc protease
MGYSAVAVSATGLSDNFDEWFALVSEIIINPNFPADELNTYKQRRNVELKYLRGDAGFLAEEQFRRAVFGDHPAATRPATAESINLITPEMLAGWHKERYAPQNTILGIAGDIDADELISKVKQRLAGWQRTSISQEPIPNPVQPSARKVYLVDRPGSVQTTIVMGNIAIGRRDPDYNSILVANHVLGADFASRLTIKLREEKGYAYQAFSYFDALGYPGPWRVRSDVRTEVTEPAIAALLEELRRMSAERVPEEEMEERKRSVASSFALSLESPFKLLDYAITRKLYSFSADYWNTYPAKVMGVGSDDVERVAQKYLNPETIQVVAVGDAGRIKPILEKYGPVEVYDTQGRQVSAKATLTSRSVTE